MGVGALTDFGPMLRNLRLSIFGAAAQLLSLIHIYRIRQNIILRYPEEERPALEEWYGNLADMMRAEGVPSSSTAESSAFHPFSTTGRNFSFGKSPSFSP